MINPCCGLQLEVGAKWAAMVQMVFSIVQMQIAVAMLCTLFEHIRVHELPDTLLVIPRVFAMLWLINSLIMLIFDILLLTGLKEGNYSTVERSFKMIFLLVITFTVSPFPIWFEYGFYMVPFEMALISIILVNWYFVWVFACFIVFRRSSDFNGGPDAVSFQTAQTDLSPWSIIQV